MRTCKNATADIARCTSVPELDGQNRLTMTRAHTFPGESTRQRVRRNCFVTLKYSYIGQIGILGLNSDKLVCIEVKESALTEITPRSIQNAIIKIKWKDRQWYNALVTGTSVSGKHVNHTVKWVDPTWKESTIRLLGTKPDFTWAIMVKWLVLAIDISVGERED